MPRTAVSHQVCVEGLGVLDFLNETLVSTSKYAASFHVNDVQKWFEHVRNQCRLARIVSGKDSVISYLTTALADANSKDGCALQCSAELGRVCIASYVIDSFRSIVVHAVLAFLACKPFPPSTLKEDVRECCEGWLEEARPHCDLQTGR